MSLVRGHLPHDVLRVQQATCQASEESAAEASAAPALPTRRGKALKRRDRTAGQFIYLSYPCLNLLLPKALVLSVRRQDSGLS